MNETNWLPGLMVLSAALMAAGLYILLTRKRQGARTGTDGPAVDAARRADALMDQLKELSVERHHLTAERFAAEKARLELATSSALQERDVLRAQTAAPSPTLPSGAPTRPPSFFSRHPQLSGALWGGGAVAFFAGAGILLGHEEKPRTEGGTMTGTVPSQASQGQAEPPGGDNGLKEALEQLRTRPDDVELASRVGHELIRRREFNDALQVTDRALGVDPFHSELRAHRAFLKVAFGAHAEGLRELSHVADTYPDAYEALLFLGMVQMTDGDKAHALHTFERFMAEAPAEEQPPQMAGALAELRRQVVPAAP